MAVHVSSVTQAQSTRKQPTDQQRGGTSSIFRTDTYLFWRLSGSHRLSKYFVNATSRTVLSKHTRSKAWCIHMHCKPVAPSSPQQQHFFWIAWTFFYLCQRDTAITFPPTTISHSWLVWLSLCSGVDELIGLSKELGWPPSPSPPARSYGFAVVKFLFKAERLFPSLVTSHSGPYTQSKLSLEYCEEELPCPHAYGERLGRSFRLRSLRLTASQVIAQLEIGRDVGSCHSEQEGRIVVGFFANFIVRKDKSMVKFSFSGVLAL